MSQKSPANDKHTRSRRKKKKNPDGTMSLVDHINELRRRLFISLVALAIGTVIGFLWYQHSIPGVPTLGEILRGPYCSLPPEVRADFSGDGHCRLLATGPFEMFLLRLKVGALAGLVFSSPVWLSQIWGFITPGLHKNERRWTFTFVSLAVTLFVAGAVLAYFVVAYGLSFLLSIGSEVQITALSGERYYNFVLGLLVIFGVSFELPLVIAMLNIAGLVDYEDLKDKRSYIIVGLFVFAAFMTPGQDPVSMLILSVALTIIVEISIQFTRINDKRRKKESEKWGDDEASPLDESQDEIAAPIPRPEKIAKPIPVNPKARRVKDYAGGTPKPRAVPRNMEGADKRGTLNKREPGDFDDVL
ncbi:twin-arginine translocase subunit TatC [Corynebacterium glucuronolyticum]|uniref:twin-arginine translocase subunit TatC n=1 Tax=Corynebacterium glucuronolyticum TaxID=39791 RepID=UPI003F6DDE02